MSALKAGWILMLIIVVIAAAGGLFVCFIPLSFHASFRGVMEPVRMAALSFPEGGEIVSVTRKSDFKKGDVLAEAACAAERQRLAAIDETLRLLKTELQDRELQNKLKAEKFKLDVERRISQTDMQREQLKLFMNLAESQNAQKKLDEELKGQSAEIFESLFKKQLVAKIEYIKVLHDKKMAELMSEQVRAQMEQNLFTYKSNLRELEIGLKTADLEKEYYSKNTWAETELAQVRYKILQTESEKAALEEKIRGKTITAPFDGQILRVMRHSAERAGAGEAVLEIGSHGLCLAGTADQTAAAEIVPGQKAEIRLDNLPFPKHAPLDGSVSDVRINISAASYIIFIAFEAAPPSVRPGFTGDVRVVIFRGTTLSYLLRTR
jgi:multidrug resistance efflux pump